MRYDLTDSEWSVIEPLLPTKRRGVKPKKNRSVIDGIFWVLRTGAPWRDLPEDTGRTRLSTTGSIAGERLASGIA